MSHLARALDDFDRLAQEAWSALPKQFRAMAGDEDFADEAVLSDMQIGDAASVIGVTAAAAVPIVVHGALQAGH
jgi:predicted Zn-dependent protease with MMP-like domain